MANIFSQNSANPNKKDVLLNLANSETPKLMEEFYTPGVAVAIIHKNEIILKKGFGFADLETQKPITDKTLFNLASVSKPVAAWGVMKLVEDRKIDLDKPIEEYLTRWKFPPSEFNKLITTRLVLSHSAGLSMGGFPGYKKEEKLPTIVEVLNGKNPNKEKLEILYKPGTDTIYSSGGFVLLQLLIEEVSGESFEDFMQKEVFQPIGMNNATFSDPTDAKNLSKMATPHQHTGSPFPQERFTGLAAAGLLATIDDMANFALAELKQKQDVNVLSSESIDLMHKPSKPSDYWGLGHAIRKVDGTKLVGHTGVNNGWRQSFQMIPETGDAIIVLTNGDNGEFIRSELTCKWFKELNKGTELEECKAAPNERYELKMLKLIIAIGVFVLLAIVGVLVWFIRKKLRAKVKK